jgi:erythromycin esterase
MGAGLGKWVFLYAAVLAVISVNVAQARQVEDSALEVIRALARPLANAADLDPLLEAVGGRRLALLGEASHGTSEFYAWRAKISRRLIEEKGFDFIAVEGDWASLYRLNRYVKGLSNEDPREIMRGFSRWPQWMWANEETAELLEWLRGYNGDRPENERIGFYGIDLYGFDDSLAEVVALLKPRKPELAEQVRLAYAGMASFEGNLQAYARSIQRGGPNYEHQTRQVVEWLRTHREELQADAPDLYFNLKQQAWVVKNAEKHIRAGLHGGAGSWNERARHFYQTTERLLLHYGPAAQGVVWAHNTHIGDARATAMAAAGRENIGQLAREALGPERVAAVGFATRQGAVVAGRQWGAAPEEMALPLPPPESFEHLLHQLEMDRLLLIFAEAANLKPLLAPRGHRAIGVIYHPEREGGNYVPTILPRRYDALIYLETTSPLKRLP